MARQWSKAVQIVDMLEPAQAMEHYQLLATHFASARDFPLAEKYFLKAGMSQVCTCIYMYNYTSSQMCVWCTCVYVHVHVHEQSLI